MKKDAPKPTLVKNRRLKMSPGGIITLPVAARKSLNMTKGVGGHVTVAVLEGKIVIAPARETGGFRVSPAGQLALQGEARGVLQTGSNRHYWIELDDREKTVRLNPFA